MVVVHAHSNRWPAEGSLAAQLHFHHTMTIATVLPPVLLSLLALAFLYGSRIRVSSFLSLLATDISKETLQLFRRLPV